MDNPYRNLNSPNIGQGFMDAFNQGQERRKQQDAQNALMQYALNPDAPGSFEGLAKTDPRMAIQMRERQQQQVLKQLEAHREGIVQGAQIVRQFGVKDQATWDAARGAAQQLGLDISDAPQVWDENAQRYVQGLVSIADAFEPQKQNAQPSSVEEYNFAKGQGFGGSYMDFLETKRGPIVANNGDGTFQIIPRGMVQGQGPVPPPPPGFVLDSGGQTDSPPSGGFPR
jgi:hypothetical protein